MRFIDSHLHLSDYARPEGVVDYAVSSETLLLAASTGRRSSTRSLELAAQFTGAAEAFVGVHPSEAVKEPNLEWLPAALSKAAGLGEIGLDPKYSDSGEGGTQMEVFAEQLRLAEETAKPVEVHSRGAEAACLDKLLSFELGGVLLHWFQGEQLAIRASGKGYFVSFGPGLLLSRKLQRIAAAYNEDLILTESDGPVGFSSLGGVGGPALVPSVVFKLAEIRGKTFEEMADTLARNGTAFVRRNGKLKRTTHSGL